MFNLYGDDLYRLYPIVSEGSTIFHKFKTFNPDKIADVKMSRITRLPYPIVDRQNKTVAIHFIEQNVFMFYKKARDGPGFLVYFLYNKLLIDENTRNHIRIFKKYPDKYKAIVSRGRGQSITIVPDFDGVEYERLKRELSEEEVQKVVDIPQSVIPSGSEVLLDFEKDPFYFSEPPPSPPPPPSQQQEYADVNNGSETEIEEEEEQENTDTETDRSSETEPEDELEFGADILMSDLGYFHYFNIDKDIEIKGIEPAPKKSKYDYVVKLILTDDDVKRIAKEMMKYFSLEELAKDIGEELIKRNFFK